VSILDLTAVELGKKIKAGEVTAVTATKAVLEQIKALEPSLNCYVTVDEEGALRTACRCTGCNQGQYVHEGSADHLQFQDSWKLCSDLLC